MIAAFAQSPIAFNAWATVPELRGVHGSPCNALAMPSCSGDGRTSSIQRVRCKLSARPHHNPPASAGLWTGVFL